MTDEPETVEIQPAKEATPDPKTVVCQTCGTEQALIAIAPGDRNDGAIAYVAVHDEPGSLDFCAGSKKMLYPST